MVWAMSLMQKLKKDPTRLRHGCVSHRARSQVFMFGRQNIFLEGKDFCHMFKTIFPGRNKIWGAMAMVTTGLGGGTKKVENHWSIGLIFRISTD